MKNKKINKKLVLLSTLLTMSIPVQVFARTASESATLKADHATATAKISAEFHWFDKDTAKASTKITKSDKYASKYRVAVRLETWETKKKCTRYTYKTGKKSVEASATSKDVVQFASRHSIDNSSNTKELVAKTMYKAE